VTQPEEPEDSHDSSSLTSRLLRVYWIGGASGSGKSTIARRLANKHGLRLYSTDEAMGDHARRGRPDRPNLIEFVKMSMDQRWVDRSPQTMLDTFHWFRGEGFGLIIEDLLALPPDQGVIAEGFRLLPHLVKPLLHDPSHGVWLIPTPEFRLAAFERRGTMWTIPNKTSDPKRALGNLLERDRLFTERLQDMLETTGLPAVRVDNPPDRGRARELHRREIWPTPADPRGQVVSRVPLKRQGRRNHCQLAALRTVSPSWLGGHASQRCSYGNRRVAEIADRAQHFHNGPPKFVFRTLTMATNNKIRFKTDINKLRLMDRDLRHRLLRTKFNRLYLWQ
jgi:hypothetical protein